VCAKKTIQGKMKQPYCWTLWIQANVECLTVEVSNMTLSDLEQRDQQFDWTLVHALFSSDLSMNVCKSILVHFKEKCLISQITAKDAEGDTPLIALLRDH